MEDVNRLLAEHVDGIGLEGLWNVVRADDQLESGLGSGAGQSSAAEAEDLFALFNGMAA
jgi:hypothetical protein